MAYSTSMAFLRFRPTLRLAACLGAVTCLVLLAAWARPSSSPTAAKASPDTAITLDGRISDGEWAGANVYDLTGSGSVSLLQTPSHVYLAVQDDTFGWSHVYVPDRDTIRVLHASAALGTAVYVREADNWRLSRPFEWGVRDTTFSAEAEAERDAFFDDHGWVATTNRMGTRRVIEFRIDKELFDPSDPRLAVLYAEEPAAPHHWPADLTDATLHPDLIRGTAPGRLGFVPRTWWALRLD